MVTVREVPDLEVLRTKTPPFSYEAEVSVLGAMMLDKVALAKALELLDESLFYKEGHRQIYKAMVSLFEKNQAVDLVTLPEELRRLGTLEGVGGMAYLAEVLDAVPTAANVEYHARIVLEKALLRRLIQAATEIVTETYTARGDVDELVDRAEQLIFSVSDHRLRQGFIPLKQMLHEAVEQVERLRERGGHGYVTGVASGFTDLDRNTTGFHAGELVVVAGRPSMGKTSFCLNIARQAALQERIPTAIFSLEMSREQLVQRLLCAEARVESRRLRGGYLTDEEMDRIIQAAGQLYNAPIYVDDTPALGVLELRAKTRRLKSEVNLGLTIVDYLQLMQGPRGAENRQQEISAISRALKALAKEVSIPVIALSQLSRSTEHREGKRPTLADLRESGAIEQDADVVIFLYREEVYDPNTVSKGVAEVIIGKNRYGPVSTEKLAFEQTFTRFENFTARTDF